MRLYKLILLATALGWTATSSAQTVNDFSNAGTPPNGLFQGGAVDTVQLGNGNLHIEIPLYTVTGRGLPLRSFFVLDTKQWFPLFVTNKSTGDSQYDISLETNGTLPGKFNTNFSYHVTQSFNPGNSSCLQYIGWSYNGIVREPNGTKHHLVPDVGATNPQCQLPTQSYADDGSGFAAFTTGNYAKDGLNIFGNSSEIMDTNGNQISQPIGANPVTDTLGRQYPFPGTYQYYDSTGTLQTIQFTTEYIPMHTHLCQFVFGGHPCVEDTSRLYVVSSITLPNGAKYSITYAQNDDGEPTSITLPSGATISWTYNAGDKGGPTVATRTVTANGQTNTWTYNYGGTTGCPAPANTCVNSVIDPLGNETDFTYQSYQNNYPGPLNLLPFVTVKQFKDKSSGSSVLVKTEQTDYSTANGPVLPIRVTTTWNQTNQVSKIETDYDSFTGISGTLGLTFSAGNPVAKREYDWGSGAPGNLLRTTNFSYLHQSNSAYLNADIVDRVTQKNISNGSFNETTNYSYDSTSITSTSGAPNHDYSGHGSTFTVRGNLTQISRWVNTTGTYLNTTNVYDDLGNLRSTTDPAGNVTSFSYADNFTDGVNRNAQAFVTQTTHPVTNGVNHIERKQYFFYSSLVAASCGQNFSAACSNSLNPPQPDYSKFTYDNMFRALTVTRGDGGSTTYSYNDTTLPLSATLSTAINSTTSKTVTTLFDDLDRIKETQLTSDPQGTVYTDTTYDALGRLATVSNPYRTGGDITTTSGTTTYFYDALGRKCLEVPPDGTLPGTGISCPTSQPGNDLFTIYSGSTITVTDQTGKSRKSVADGLGRVTQVFEDPAGLNYETDYSFDALDNLLTVNQKGGSTNSALWRTRTFTYDSLARLLTSINPEVGTITYKYDSDTNCASPNSFPDLLVSKTDARGIRTCAQFDPLDRETVRNYSSGDPTITSTYDQSNCLGLTSCQNIGHRTSMTDAAGSEAWSFDVVDRIHRDQRTTSGVTKTTTYNLDYAGNTVQATYPTNRVVNYTFDAANRPSTVQDASNGITYTTGFKTSPGGTCLANVTCYTPQGTFYALSIGQSSTFTNGLNLTHIYNSRLQPQEFKASSSGGNAIDISYSFLDSSGHNAGHVYGITNNLDGTRSQTFSYDSLNRLTAGQTTSTYSTSQSHCWAETYTLDAWANLNNIAATTNPNYTGCSLESGFSSTADTNNHLPAWGYDASGNATSDGFVTNYQWDGESQLKFAAGVNYSYDGDGRRVSKSNGKLYWYDGGSEILAETDASGNTTAEYIFFAGQRIAMIPAGGSPTYFVEDLLGTSRVLTTNTGVVCYDADFYPFGGERTPYVNTCPQNYKFEGKERDTETGNDDFGARYYSNRFGRWLSADWSAVPVPVPYANLSNPQTLNLYAMVADDPESFADLDGHQDPDPEKDKEEKEVESKEDREWDAAKELADKANEAEVAARLAQLHDAWLRGQKDGYDDKFTGVCYAPNPNAGEPVMRSSRPGTLGKPDHQQTAKEEAEKIGGKTEDTIATPNGQKGSRRGDAVKRDANGKVTDVVQVIRPNKNGTPPKRERDAAADIEKATGIKPRFVPVRPIRPGPKPKVFNPNAGTGTGTAPNGGLHETGGPN